MAVLASIDIERAGLPLTRVKVIGTIVLCLYPGRRRKRPYQYEHSRELANKVDAKFNRMFSGCHRKAPFKCISVLDVSFLKGHFLYRVPSTWRLGIRFIEVLSKLENFVNVRGKSPISIAQNRELVRDHFASEAGN